MPEYLQYSGMLATDKEEAHSIPKLAWRTNPNYVMEDPSFEDCVELSSIGSVLKRASATSCFTTVDIDSLPEGITEPDLEKATADNPDVSVMPSSSGNPSKCHVMWRHPTTPKRFRDDADALLGIVKEYARDYIGDRAESIGRDTNVGYWDFLFGSPSERPDHAEIVPRMPRSVRIMANSKKGEAFKEYSEEYAPSTALPPERKIPYGFTVCDRHLASECGVDAMPEFGVRFDIKGIPFDRLSRRWGRKPVGERHMYGLKLASKVALRALYLNHEVYSHPSFSRERLTATMVGEVFEWIFLHTVEKAAEYFGSSRRELNAMKTICTDYFSQHDGNPRLSLASLVDSFGFETPKRAYRSRLYTKNRVRNLLDSAEWLPEAVGALLSSGKTVSETLSPMWGVSARTIAYWVERLMLEEAGVEFRLPWRRKTIRKKPARTRKDSDNALSVCGYPVLEEDGVLVLSIPKHEYTPYARKQKCLLSGKLGRKVYVRHV